MISIITYIFNSENYIHVCLNSILKQSYQDFEVICIDNASYDSSCEILEYFTRKDSRIKLLKNDVFKSEGFCRNLGLNLSKGDYVYFLDVCGWLNFNSLEILINQLENNQLDLLFFKNSIYLEENNNFLNEERLDKNIFNQISNKTFNHYDLEKQTVFSLLDNFFNTIFSKSFLNQENINFCDDNFLLNFDSFFLDILTSAKKIRVLDEYLYNNRKILMEKVYDNQLLVDNIHFIPSILEIFMKNKKLYNYYKKEILNYIFKEILYDNFIILEKNYKDHFFIEAQTIIKIILKKYGILNDILENVERIILDEFNITNILEVIINPPKVSIILPVYNVENELLTAFNSIINQTLGFDNIELIVIDDCSTDNSSEIIDIFSKKYNNILSIHLNQNSGTPSKPRNIGLRNASADFIIFQDSDDTLTKDACKNLYDIIVEGNVDIVTGMITRNDLGNDFEIFYNPWISIINDEFNMDNMDSKCILDSEDLFKLRLNSIEDNPYILEDYSFFSKIYKKSFLINNDISFPENVASAEDSVFLLNSYINASGIIFINKVIYNYNAIRETNASHDISEKTVGDKIKSYNLMYDLAVSNNKKDLFVKIVLLKKLRFWFNEYLFKIHKLNDSFIYSIFNSYQILFSECINYNLGLPNYIIEICNHIKNNDFEDAICIVKKVRNNENGIE